jgi:hypothetical protein
MKIPSKSNQFKFSSEIPIIEMQTIQFKRKRDSLVNSSKHQPANKQQWTCGRLKRNTKTIDRSNQSKKK